MRKPVSDHNAPSPDTAPAYIEIAHTETSHIEPVDIEPVDIEPEQAITMSRRNLLRVAGAVSLGTFVVGSAGVAAASTRSTKKPAKKSAKATTTTGTKTATSAATGAAASTSCSNTVIPRETAGPFPGDGSNGVNILNKQGVVRSDISSSFGASTTKAAGVPLTVILTVVDAAIGCAALPGAAVYLWHADQVGAYSMYTAPNENYLRGVQAADTNGVITFKTVFPGAYDGRWPHMHFEVFSNIENALARRNILATSQLALPEVTCNVVYAVKGYETSVGNMKRTSLATDMVFRDGAEYQMPTMSGSIETGFVARLVVPV